MDLENEEAILSALASGDPEKQVQGLIQLIKNSDKRKLAHVLGLFDAEDEMVRSEAARAAGFLGGDDIEVVGPRLVRLLSDSDDLVRNEAAESLAKLRFLPAAPVLIERMRTDPEWIVRASAAEALGIYPEVSVAALVACVRETDELIEVRRYAVHSLGMAGGYLSHDDAEILLRDLGDDPDIGLQVRLAAYRLGFGDQLDIVEHWSATVDEFQSSLLLNDFSTMLDRPRPPTLPRDRDRIRALVDVIALRWPREAVHANRVRQQLAEHTRIGDA
ncbi:HEAT repeat domain-containing protein [Nocardia sp. NPDC005366]|uniref:HEAT repeat domain-containing protein n=1 Tax=Nocardia sp. NPDC005366 TaxID=3156878 RepID=UPI0033AC39C9